MPKNTNFDAIWRITGVFFRRNVALDGYFHPLDRPIDGMEMEIHGMDRSRGRMKARKIRWMAGVGRCPL